MFFSAEKALKELSKETTGNLQECYGTNVMQYHIIRLFMYLIIFYKDHLQSDVFKHKHNAFHKCLFQRCPM